MSSQSQPPQPGHNLGPEFPPDDALDDMLERLLLEDGAQWRANTAPELEPFARRVNVALREHRNANENGVYSLQRPGEERPMADRPVTRPPQAMSQPSTRRRPSVWGTLISVAAAVAVVATLAGVFHALSNPRVATPAATPTLAPHVTHARGHWTDVLQYTLGSTSGTSSIIVSPLDPRIAYRTIFTSPLDPNMETLARTSDGGATWTTFTLPTVYGSSGGSIAFSPLDPQTVFATVGGDPLTDSQCDDTSGGSCFYQFVSHDSGAHWSQQSFPWGHATFVGYSGYGSSGFPGQVQGTTLFATVRGGSAYPGGYYGDERLVLSTDDGSTWSAADSAIYAAGQVVMNYTAIPGTTSLYAMSLPQNTPYDQEKNAAVWSSEDDGAHWTRVGPAPFALATLTGTTRTPGSSTLYAVGQPPPPGDGLLSNREPIGIDESRDGGRTWVPVPSTGWPLGQSPDPYDIWSLTTLADGSLLLQFFDTLNPNKPFPPLGVGGNVSFYAWRPGDTTWFPVTPLPGGGTVVQAWLTSPANGPQSLWIVVAPTVDEYTVGPTYTVRQCVLQ